MVGLVLFVLWLFWSVLALSAMSVIWCMVCVPLTLLVPEETSSDGSRFGFAALTLVMMFAWSPVIGAVFVRMSL